MEFYEHGMEKGLIVGQGGTTYCVDSGATSHSVPEEAEQRLLKVTNRRPDITLTVANGVGLPVKVIGSMVIELQGWKLVDGVKIPAKSSVLLNRVLVVPGLKSYLLSVRKLRDEDGVNTYFNDDNSVRTADCILDKRTGTVQQFLGNGQAHEVVFASTEITVQLAHVCLGHISEKWLAYSNVTMNGIAISKLCKKGPPHNLNTTDCRGCRLGGTRRKDRSHRSEAQRRIAQAHRSGQTTTIAAATDAPRSARLWQPISRPNTIHRTETGSVITVTEQGKPTVYGQRIQTDICTAFPASFPHGFRQMINFVDEASREAHVLFLISPTSEEVEGALREFSDKVRDRLPNGRIGVWITDNGLMFDGDTVRDAAEELTKLHHYQLPNDSNTLAAAESNWGTVENMVRRTLAHADAPLCLWPWAATQMVNILKFLPCHGIDMSSPYSFNNPTEGPPDISWAAHPLFCDVTVHLTKRDRDNKLSHTGADGTYLGYDHRRAGHIVYIPSLQRIGTFSVTRWRHESFTQCKGLTHDSPCEYHQVDDIEAPPATDAQIPRQIHRSGRAQRDRAAAHPPPPVVPVVQPVGPIVQAALMPQPVNGEPVVAFPMQQPDQANSGNAEGLRVENRGSTSSWSGENRGSADSESADSVPLFSEYERGWCGFENMNAASMPGPDRVRLCEELRSERMQDMANDPLAQFVLRSTADKVWDGEDIVIIADVNGTLLRVAEVGSIPVPRTVEEAKALPQWALFRDAMDEEIKGKLKNKAWTVVDRPDRRVMKSRWVFTVKYKADGSVLKVKARFVACGYSQIEGADFSEIYAATLPGVSFRVFMSLCAADDMETDHIDAVKAFTQANLDTELYCEMPEMYSVPGKVLYLYKALEGIRQGAHLWFNLNSSVLKKIGLSNSLLEPNIYTHPSLPIRFAVFADDVCGAFHESARSDYLRLRKAYAKAINIDSKEINPIEKFTGVEITRDRAAKTLTLKMTRYIEQLAELYQGAFTVNKTPIPDSKAARERFEQLRPAPEGEETFDRSKYLSLMGALMWPATMVHAHIAVYVTYLCTAMMRPTEAHFKYGLHILGYLVSCKNLGITYGGKLKMPMGVEAVPGTFHTSLGLHAYSDSSWGKTPRPMAGYVIMLNNGMVDWSARMLKIVADSTCEAEIAIASKATKSVIFVRHLLETMKRNVSGPTLLLVDNQALIKVVTKDGATARTRYFDRATILVKEQWMRRVVEVLFVRTTDEVADIFTKATDTATFHKMVPYIFISSLPSEQARRAHIGKLNTQLHNLLRYLDREGVQDTIALEGASR